MLVDLKNSPDLITSSYGPTIVDKFDFSVIEECVSFLPSDLPHPLLSLLAGSDDHTY
jgi:hypothetical protein